VSTIGSNLQQETKAAVEAEFAARQAALLQEVKNSIADALKTDQRVVVIADQKKEEKSRRWWDIAQIVIPALLTGLVGFGVWYTQNRLSNEITAANQALSTRYVLTQEYDKEKFKVYQRTIERLTVLENALAGAQYPMGRSNAVTACNSLDDEVNHSEFYFSPDILAELKKVSYLASTTKDINPGASGKASAVETQIDTVKTKIRDEVRKEMGRLPAQK